MAPIRLVNLLALSSLAILACSFNAVPVSAVAADNHHHVARNFGHGHHEVAKRKRDVSKRCKTKSKTSSSAAPAATTHSAAVAVAVTASSADAAASPAPTKKASSTPKAATSTKASAKAVATTAASTSSNGSGKVGLCWSNGEASSIPNFITPSVKFIYNWKPTLDYGMKTDGLTYIPMLWGTKYLDTWKSTVKAGYSNYAAGFNEPDISSQSNIDAGYAAQLWKEYMNPLKNEGYTLLSPATATGIKWMQQFENACNGGCQYDIVAVHVYTTTVDNFKTAVSAYRTFNKPIMVTEYACHDYSGNNNQCSSDDIWSFMSGTNSWMESQGDIAGYFFFGKFACNRS
ncbi:glycosyl hydrolase catalytic core-domain-containing protein [Amylostereum chailletii]|nr:glycosyl hydrolase catalytic core-domain-containing protein [Amylostereum chailletii]